MKTMHLPKSRIEQLIKDGRCCIDRDLRVGYHIEVTFFQPNGETFTRWVLVEEG